MEKVIIYTDGSCLNNPGRGGWACILISKNKYKELSGAEDNTTNNRMEMTAIIKAIESLKKPCEVDLYSDSAYVINAFNNDWITRWIKKDWQHGKDRPVLNADLWQKLIEVIEPHTINFLKVKGHSDDIYNNRCDKLARGEASKL